MNRCRWLFCLLMCCCAIFSNAAQLQSLSVTQYPGKTSIYLGISGAFTHKVFMLPNPNRVVLDLKDTSLKTNLNQPGLTGALIQKVRSGAPDKKTLRLVFDITQSVQVKSSSWDSKGIRIDLSSGTAINPQPAAMSVTKPVEAPVVITHSMPVHIPHPPANTFRDVIIVLDAGHGGKDPGAKGPRRSQEKNVVLAITLKLKQLIDRQPGMRAVLTRSGDYYVGLRQRLDIARKYNGDIFVSIHADAFNNPHSNGASVFALSQSGATSEAARWLAEKENYSELGGVNLGDLDDTNGVVRSVLIDLSQTATINSSLQMGGRVLHQLDGFTNLHNNNVEQAGFVVLKSTDIPSILVETGFISNPIEERNLTNPAYQAQLSQAIFRGIKGYFWDNPPHGTRIESMTSQRIHIVKKGESGPSIANQYKVSVEELLAFNRLNKKATLQLGQKIVIPSSWA